MKSFLRGLIAASALVLAIGQANASTFNVSGVFLSAPAITLTGTLDVDTALGAVTGANLTVLGLPAFTVVDVSGVDPPVGWALELSNGVSLNSLHVHFSTSPVAASLVGFTGGAMYAGLAFAPDFFVLGLEGSITAADAVATPLPGALPLFLTGVAAFGLLARRRKKQAVAA